MNLGTQPVNANGTTAFTSGIPAVLPTNPNSPFAKLVVKSELGQVIQQWLLLQNKCTLGSAASCALRCQLAGIAPYHALLVVGARQVFIRALSPKLSRNGVMLNEVLLTEDQSTFEIAGHQFELIRNVKTNEPRTSNTPSAGKLKFTLARPMEIGQVRQPTVFATQPSTQAPRPTQFVEGLQQRSSSDLQPQWITDLIQSAMLPLERQLNEIIEPLAAVQNKLAKQSRLERKRRKQKANRVTAEAALTPQTDEQPQNTHAPEPVLVPIISPEVQSQLAIQNESLDNLNFRLNEVKNNLGSLERVVSENFVTVIDAASAPVPTPEPVYEALQRISSVADQLSGLTTQLGDLKGNLNSLERIVSENLVSTNELRAAPEPASTDTLQRLADVANQLSHLLQEINSRQISTGETDLAWREQLRVQIGDLRDSVSATETSILRATESSLKATEASILASTDSLLKATESSIQRATDSSLKATETTILQSTDSSLKATESSILTATELTILKATESFAANVIQPPIQNSASPTSIATVAHVEAAPMANADLCEPSQTESVFTQPTIEPATQAAYEPAIPLQTIPEPTISEYEFSEQAVPEQIISEQAISEQIISEQAISHNEFSKNDWVESAVEPIGIEVAETLEEAVAPSQVESEFVSEVELPINFFSPYEWNSEPSEEEACEKAIEPLPEPSPVTEPIDSISGWEVQELAQPDLTPTLPEQVNPSNDFSISDFTQPETATSENEVAEVVEEFAEIPSAESFTGWGAEESVSSSSELEYTDNSSDFIEEIIEEAPMAEEAPSSALPAWWTEDDKTQFKVDQSASATTASIWNAPANPSVGPPESEWQPGIGINEFAQRFPTQPESVEFHPSSNVDFEEAIDRESPPVSDFSQQSPIAEEFVNDESLNSDEPSQFSSILERFGIARESFSSETDSPSVELPIFDSEESFEREESDDEIADMPEAVSPNQELDVAPMPEFIAADGTEETASGEEESIEDYMKRLMARMRGGSAEELAKPSVSAPVASSPPAPPESSSSTNTTKILLRPATERVSMCTTGPFNPDDYIPKALAPEKPRNMAAMRELANTSARSAIHVSARRRYGTAIALKLAIALTGLGVGSLLVMINGLNVNIGLIATVASFLVALIWGFDAFSTLKPILSDALEAKNAPVNPPVTEAEGPPVEDEVSQAKE